MRVKVNGKKLERAAPDRLGHLLAEWKLHDLPAVAVARNGEIIPRAEWEATPLHDSDEIEIVSAAAGG